MSTNHGCPPAEQKPFEGDRYERLRQAVEILAEGHRPADTAIKVWCDYALAPFHGSCNGCGRELSRELVATTDGSGWCCTACLAELVRAMVLAELTRGRCA